MVPTLRRSFENPWDLFREVDRAFRDGVHGAVHGATYPVDIHETPEAFTIEADLPGFRKEDLDVSVDAGLLTITATRHAPGDRGEARLEERRFEQVQRSFRLPQTVQGDQIDASLADGVLTVSLPKRDEVKPRRVEVR